VYNYLCSDWDYRLLVLRNRFVFASLFISVCLCSCICLSRCLSHFTLCQLLFLLQSLSLFNRFIFKRGWWFVTLWTAFFTGHRYACLPLCEFPWFQRHLRSAFSYLHMRVMFCLLASGLRRKYILSYQYWCNIKALYRQPRGNICLSHSTCLLCSSLGLIQCICVALSFSVCLSLFLLLCTSPLFHAILSFSFNFFLSRCYLICLFDSVFPFVFVSASLISLLTLVYSSFSYTSASSSPHSFSSSPSSSSHSSSSNS